MVEFDLGRCGDGNHLVPSGIEFLSQPLDVAALSGRIPALIDDDRGKPFAKALEPQLSQAILEFLELGILLRPVELLAEIDFIEDLRATPRFDGLRLRSGLRIDLGSRGGKRLGGLGTSSLFERFPE
jgi:hypothetical protein